MGPFMHTVPCGIQQQPQHTACLPGWPLSTTPLFGDITEVMQVAEDECRHHELLRARLEEMGSFYGAFPAHDALWDSAAATAHSLPARLAIEHCTHEARGLDVMPFTIHKFRFNGDEATAKLLEDIIYKVCSSLDCCIGTSCACSRNCTDCHASCLLLHLSHLMLRSCKHAHCSRHASIWAPEKMIT